MNRGSHFTITLAPLMIVAVLWLAGSPAAFGYGVLTHQATVDAVWHDTFQPLLQQRFPHASAQELRDARAYALVY